MTCHFGEIVYPLSRAFWGDDEYDVHEDTMKKTKFALEWIDEAPTVIEKLIVIEGDVFTDFVKVCLVGDSEKVCIIKSSGANKEPSVIYKNDNDLYICVIGVEVDLPCSAEFIEQIQDVLNISKLIIAVTYDHISHFKSTEKPQSPSFLRKLCTKNGKSACANDIQFLSQPNIISGVVAGVVSYAESMQVPAVLYILYTDTFVLDSKSVIPLSKLFSNILGYILPEYLPSAKGFFSKENIYMYFYCLLLFAFPNI